MGGKNVDTKTANDPSIKFELRRVGSAANPIFFVGVAPGRQRKKEQTRKAWEGNKSSDLMNDATKHCKNAVYTNISNEYIPTRKISIDDDAIIAGSKKLASLILHYKPHKILLFSTFTARAFKKHVQSNAQLSTHIENTAIIELQHPSYVLRFNKDKTAWIKEVQHAITK